MKFKTLTPSTAGLHRCVMEIEGLPEMRLTLRLPTAAANPPLVLVLHYGGQATGYYGEALVENLVFPAWRELNAVIVAPVSLGADWLSPDNVRMLDALLPLIESTYGTAAERRFITGYSLGGIGCWHQLQVRPTYFAAAVPIASRLPDSLAAITTPFHALHSDTDQLFPVGDFPTLVATHAAAGADATFTVLAGVDHFDFTAYAAKMGGLVPWLETIRG